MTVRRRFENRRESVTAARRFAREVLEDEPHELLEAVELMVSELATNSIRHASSSFELAIDRSQRGVRVEVSDAGPGRPEVRNPAPLEPSGRGLRIVEALADAWGVKAQGKGKTVWFTIAPHAERARAAV